MSAPLAFSDFSLAPTLVRRFQYQLGFALAHSRRYNIRRLESHSYAPWGMISDDLLAGLSAQALTVSQLNITSSVATDGISPDFSMNSFTPKDRKERTPDFTGIFLAAKRRGQDPTLPEHILNAYLAKDVLSDLILATEDAIDTTVPFQYTAHPSQLEDIAAFVDLLSREVLNWHLLKLSAHVTLFHTEVKRPVSRRVATADRFFNLLTIALSAGFDSVDKQTEVIFLTEPETDHLISIASTGEFWSFRISVRNTNAKAALEERFKEPEYDFLDLDATPRFKTSKSPPSNETKPLRKEQTRGSLPTEWTTLQHAPRRSLTEAGFVFNPEQVRNTPEQEKKMGLEGPGGQRTRPKQEVTGLGQILDPVVEDDDEDEAWVDEDDWIARTGPSSVASDFEAGDRSFNHFGDSEAQSQKKAESNSYRPGARKGKGRIGHAKKSEHPIRYLQPSNQGQAESMEKFVWRLRDALPELGQWSGTILFGTPASNQRLYMIRELLRREIRPLEREYDRGIAPELGGPQVSDSAQGFPVAHTDYRLAKDIPGPSIVLQADRSKPIAVPKAKKTRSRSRSGMR
ncbi:hypothetical protein MD484_g7411, partial [Candolleomyces efflorescens]